MASPIILKALPISETHAVPIALLLNAPHVWESGLPGVKLIRGGDVVDIDPSRLQPQPRSLNPDPNGLMAPARTVREAFLAYVESQWGNAKGVL